MSKKIFRSDAMGLTREIHLTDDGMLVDSTVQDVDPFLQHAHDLRMNNPDGYNIDKSFKHLASIPLVLIEDWYKKGFDVIGKRKAIAFNQGIPTKWERMSNAEFMKEMRVRLQGDYSKFKAFDGNV